LPAQEIFARRSPARHINRHAEFQDTLEIIFDIVRLRKRLFVSRIGVVSACFMVFQDERIGAYSIELSVPDIQNSLGKSIIREYRYQLGRSNLTQMSFGSIARDG